MIILIISLVFFFFGWRKWRQAKKINSEREIAIKAEEKRLQDLIHKQEAIEKENRSLLKSRDKLIKDIQKEKENTDKIYEEEKIRLLKLVDGCKASASAARDQYFDSLEKFYQEQEQLFDSKINALESDYGQQLSKFQEEIEDCTAELDKLRKTRAAAIAAQLKEQEIKDKLEFYCLHPKTTDIQDVQILERVKPQLKNPRILSMLIWSTYFQKDMTALCNNVLGTNTVCGIYKITNQTNNKCYIGQSVDISRRWKDHAKCGLGIDTPDGNKLYKEMQEIGIWNFSWELLEKCSREELNEKERFYIELYQSKDYGYNTLKGVNQ